MKKNKIFIIGGIALPAAVAAIIITYITQPVFTFNFILPLYRLCVGIVLTGTGIALSTVILLRSQVQQKERSGFYRLSREPVSVIFLFLFFPGVAFLVNSSLLLFAGSVYYVVASILISIEEKKSIIAGGSSFLRYIGTVPLFLVHKRKYYVFHLIIAVILLSLIFFISYQICSEIWGFPAMIPDSPFVLYTPYFLFAGLLSLSFGLCQITRYIRKVAMVVLHSLLLFFSAWIIILSLIQLQWYSKPMLQISSSMEQKVSELRNYSLWKWVVPRIRPKRVEVTTLLDDDVSVIHYMKKPASGAIDSVLSALLSNMHRYESSPENLCIILINNEFTDDRFINPDFFNGADLAAFSFETSSFSSTEELVFQLKQGVFQLKTYYQDLNGELPKFICCGVGLDAYFALLLGYSADSFYWTPDDLVGFDLSVDQVLVFNPENFPKDQFPYTPAKNNEGDILEEYYPVALAAYHNAIPQTIIIDSRPNNIIDRLSALDLPMIAVIIPHGSGDFQSVHPGYAAPVHLGIAVSLGSL